MILSILATTAITGPAFADYGIRLSEDGLSIVMPVETYRMRETYILRIEQENRLLKERCDIYEAAQRESDATIDDYILENQALRELNHEKNLAYAKLVADYRYEAFTSKMKWGGVGFLIGIGAGIAIGR